MKTILSTCYLLALVLLFAGCSKVIYTHNQVMARYQNKKQVVAAFGLPSEKHSGEGIEEWLYNYGPVTTESTLSSENRGMIAYAAASGSNSPATTNSVTVTQFSQYSRFVKFTFDANGNVLKWQSQGIDNAERVKNTKGTILCAIGGAAVAVALVALVLSLSPGN